MRNGTFYMNNSGSRFINFTNGKKDQVLVFHGDEGYCKKRVIDHYEMLGNSAVACLKYKGKMIKGFIEDCNGVLVLFVDYKEKYKN